MQAGAAGDEGPASPWWAPKVPVSLLRRRASRALPVAVKDCALRPVVTSQFRNVGHHMCLKVTRRERAALRGVGFMKAAVELPGPCPGRIRLVASLATRFQLKSSRI